MWYVLCDLCSDPRCDVCHSCNTVSVWDGCTYSLLLDSHLSLQQLRHVAHRQNHMVHPGLHTHVQTQSKGDQLSLINSNIKLQPPVCWLLKLLLVKVSAPPPAYLHQCLHLVQQDGLVAEVHQWFGDAQGQRSQPGPVTPDKDQSLHASAVSNSYQGDHSSSMARQRPAWAGQRRQSLYGNIKCDMLVSVMDWRF